MHIRRMTHADSAYVAEIAVTSYLDDEVMKWMYPLGSQYPHDQYLQRLIRIKERLSTPRMHPFVAVSDATDVDFSGRSEVIGYIFWHRRGDDKFARRIDEKDTLLNKLNRYLSKWEQWYQRNFQDQATRWDRMEAFSSPSRWKFRAEVKDYWWLSGVAVHPQHQRKGIAKSLMEWGLEIAQREHVPILLEASAAGRRVYEKVGFRVVETASVAEGWSQQSVVMRWDPGADSKEI